MRVDDIQRIGASLDDKTLEVVISRAEAGEHVQILIVGSEAIADAAERFSTVISDKYGDLIGVDVATFDMTSARFVAEELDDGGIIGTRATTSFFMSHSYCTTMVKSLLRTNTSICRT